MADFAFKPSSTNHPHVDKAFAAAYRADSQHEGNKPETRARAAREALRWASKADEVAKSETDPEKADRARRAADTARSAHKFASEI